MATLAEYLDRTDLTALKAYLGITGTGEDTQLRQWYGTAIDWCNIKLSRRDFTAAEGFTGDVPPDQVVTGVYEYVGAMRDSVVRIRGGIRKSKTGARETEYFGPEAGRTNMAGLAAWPHLEPWITNALNLTSGGGW